MNYIKNSNGITIVRSIYGRIRIELSIDNGSTFPYVIVASYNCGSFDENNPDRTVNIPVTIPNITGLQCYFRYTSLEVSGMTWLSNKFGIISPNKIAIMLNEMRRLRKKRRHYI